MKRILFIGNRLNVLSALPEFKQLNVIGVYAQEDSLLHRKLGEIELPAGVSPRIFNLAGKADVIKEIESLDFDILISNGCPIILPVAKLKKPHQLFINIHPTLLPDLKGKTPLNGVFMTHRHSIGATMHYINAGIDTGNIIAQAEAQVTPDLDQGLVYKISFDLESEAFRRGMKRIIDSDYLFPGTQQDGEGSYFNRTDELQTIDFEVDDTDVIIDKIKSFGIHGQGSFCTIGGLQYRVYAGQKIVNTYLLQTYGKTTVGDVAFAYDDKLVVKARDGLIKLIDYDESSSRD